MFRNHFMRISVDGSRIEDGVFAGDIYALVSLRVMHVVQNYKSYRIFDISAYKFVSVIPFSTTTTWRFSLFCLFTPSLSGLE